MAKWIPFCLAVLLAISMSAISMASHWPKPQQPDKTGLGFGPADGSVAPAFSARDQFGNQQTLKTIAGKNGTVLLFFRSADW
ncbi:MAG TPA: hypothetical protein VJX67_25795 [Blastocatellia bacterium]|nr:hypothetical protein [Blastocatellia bacterium]